jgi:hypothetical protein
MVSRIANMILWQLTGLLSIHSTQFEIKREKLPTEGINMANTPVNYLRLYPESRQAFSRAESPGPLTP